MCAWASDGSQYEHVALLYLDQVIFHVLIISVGRETRCEFGPGMAYKKGMQP